MNKLINVGECFAIAAASFIIITFLSGVFSVPTQAVPPDSFVPTSAQAELMEKLEEIHTAVKDIKCKCESCKCGGDCICPVQTETVAAVPDPAVRNLSINGETHDLNQYLENNYVRDWSYRGNMTVDQRLLSYGVTPDELACLNDDEKQRVFSAYQEVKWTNAPKQAAQGSNGSGGVTCVNGRCYRW